MTGKWGEGVKKQWKIAIIVTAVVAVLVGLMYILPIPVHVDITAQGAEIGVDGTPGQAVTVFIKGWKRQYLLGEDRNTIKARIIIRKADGTVLLDTQEEGQPFHYPMMDYAELDARIWSEFLKHGSLRVLADFKMEQIYLKVKDAEYAVSTNGSSPEGVLEHFGWLLN